MQASRASAPARALERAAAPRWLRWRRTGREVCTLVAVALVTIGIVLFAPGQPAARADQGAPAWQRGPAAVQTAYAANLRAMRAAGPDYAHWATAGRQILTFDPRGNGRVVEVFGDLAHADRIAVLVPGVDTRGTNFTTGLGDMPARAPSVQASNLYAAVRAGEPAAHVAVIAWLGYDTPSGVGRDAAREELARAGAFNLEEFVESLTRLRPHADVSVLGHSYGSVVTGLAAAELPAQVHDLVVFGSPGMGVDRAAELHTHARLWAGRAASDWIDWVPAIRVLGVGHGTPPTTPGFGAHDFGTRGVVDHDHYLSPGTRSLANIADIVLGRDSLVH